ncbi:MULTISPECIES: histidine phosphatase family protein [Paenibacillus]|uniref:histidine phosphatase family protein n=2 Tax=Paenibacillus TaxID=44249 RepID=UPI00048AB7BD|nr:histidine phosphatase family protein [Paenibacillus sp. IHBB 10380]
MKIGIVRHFKVVDDSRGRWMTSTDFNHWVEHYNQCSIQVPESSVGLKWDICYSSDQSRAVKSAEHLFIGSIIRTDLLREIEIQACINTNVRLHRSFWLILGRIGWLLNHASQENKRDTLHRAKRIMDEIESNESRNILVVTHGAFMTILKKELKRRGYKGEPFMKPENGRVYIYER